MEPRSLRFSVVAPPLLLTLCLLNQGCLSPEAPLGESVGDGNGDQESRLDDAGAHPAGDDTASAASGGDLDVDGSVLPTSEGEDGPSSSESTAEATSEVPPTNEELPAFPIVPFGGRSLPRENEGPATAPSQEAAEPGAADDSSSESTIDDGTFDDGTTGEPPVVSEPTYETVRLYVDHYMQACSSWEGQLFCHRVSEDAENWFVDYELFLYFFQWGFTYVVDGHFEEKTKSNGEVTDEFKVDEIVSEERVDPLTRFDMSVDPNYSEQGKLEHIALYSAAGRVIGGSITTRPLFFCYPETCEALGSKMAGEEPFVVTFEYNAFMRLFAVEVDGQVAKGLPTELTERLRADWAASQPDSYVVRDCTDAEDPVCTRAVVENGAILSLSTRVGDAEWTEVELLGDEIDPIDRQFVHLELGEVDSSIHDFRVDPDYHYISRIDYGVPGTSLSHELDCFVADSLDADACAD